MRGGLSDFTNFAKFNSLDGFEWGKGEGYVQLARLECFGNPFASSLNEEVKSE